VTLPGARRKDKQRAARRAARRADAAPTPRRRRADAAPTPRRRRAPAVRRARATARAGSRERRGVASRTMRRGTLFTLPNVLSLSRVVLVPFFVAAATPGARVAIVGVAALTDLLDGWLARRRRSDSRLGAILDPIADRLFVLGALAAFLSEGALTVWQGALLLSRDIATTIGFFVARSAVRLRSVELRARMPGKVVTVLQLATLLSVLLRPSLVAPLAALTGVASVVAIADYTRMLWRGRAP
jgi:CDP-diacylglycerol--glycerol-3-phosphate 3-phosphatidyltransferase/cardiolipin synthase